LLGALDRIEQGQKLGFGAGGSERLHDHIIWS
jgi:hypothetical protein